jgi:hypothetical protein
LRIRFLNLEFSFMPAVVYVVRSLLLTLSCAFFSGNNPAVVLSLEDLFFQEKSCVRRISPD